MAYQISRRERGFNEQMYINADAQALLLNKFVHDTDYTTFPVSCFDYSETAKRTNTLNTMTSPELLNCLNSYDALCTIWQRMLHEGIIVSEMFGMVEITSHFRNAKVNRMVGGSSNSLHLFGLALDFVGPSTFINLFYEYVVENYIKSDSLIFEDRNNWKLFPREVIRYYDGHPSKSRRIHIGFRYVSTTMKQRELELPY